MEKLTALSTLIEPLLEEYCAVIGDDLVFACSGTES